MNADVPNYIEEALKYLEQQVCRDSYNLTRDNHDAINARIQQLRGFIYDLYRSKRTLRAD